MTSIIQPGNPLIFMKVGIHAKETIEEILERKQREFDLAGKIFWGYGGSTCHPRTMVQPFAREAMTKGQIVNIMMQKMDSNHFAEPVLAKEYSEDGIEWDAVPTGIEVRGSRFALVLGEIHEAEFDFNYGSLGVAVGPSRGKSAADYLKGQVDKGCFEVQEPDEVREPGKSCHIDLVAPVLAPYAVFLR